MREKIKLQKRSMRAYIALILLLAGLSALNMFLPQGDVALGREQRLPLSEPLMALVYGGIMLVLYGGLGFLGLLLARRLGFPGICDADITTRQRFFIPLLWGGTIGLFFVAADVAFAGLHALGRLPHPPFPASLAASAAAGIGEEVMFRLFFIPFWLWLIGSVLFKVRDKTRLFWGVSAFSALAFALAHLPAAMILYDFASIAQVPAALLVEIILLNGVLALAAAYLFRAYGFLAAVGVHFWVDIVWHVGWGALG